MQITLQNEEWLMQATIEELQRKLAAGEFTSRQLVLMYMDRIARFDQDGMKINSILEINPEALLIADALDRERRIQGPRSLLHGIPLCWPRYFFLCRFP